MNVSPSAAAASTLAELVDQTGARHADAPILLAPSHAPLSGARLASRARGLAASLASAGIGVRDRVGVVLPNGPDMAVAVLGIASRCACAPLSPALTRGELAAAYRDLALRAVVCDHAAHGARDAAAEAGIDAFILSEEPGNSELQRSAHSNLAPAGSAAPPQPADIALLLRTSGTTSRPKRVPLTHANLLASAHSIAQTLALGPADRCLNIMPLFHIHGLVGVLLSSLTAGASVVCTPGLDLESFFGWLASFGPTWYSAVPTMHQAILRQATAQAHEARSARLRFIRSASASLPPGVMAELAACLDAPVIEAYGMTEASHQIASNPLPPGVRKPGSVGPPAGAQVRIIGADGRDAAPSACGEIVIRGPGVTAGYEADAAVNDAAFIDGWLRTGDEGCFDDDGYLFITGRLKEMINRGGQKVSPKEIDEALLDHPHVLEAAAFAVSHPTWGEDVAAAVVARDRTVGSESALRGFLVERLASYKVPSRILIVDAIPKGPTGKIERASLAARLLPADGPAYAEPRGARQVEVAAMFAEALDIARVGATDNFWALGGDSLRATRVIARLQSQYGLELPILTMFQHPTVEELAARIDALIGRGGV